MFSATSRLSTVTQRRPDIYTVHTKKEGKAHIEGNTNKGFVM